MNKGILYIVTTPIGNLSDISIRAKNILSKTNYIASEDTRKTGLLLKLLEIQNKPMLISYYEGKEFDRIPNILNILNNGEDVALVSDSGTPLISDPGYPLVRECIKEQIKVVPIPGAAALITALVASGQPPDKFIFLGFLPKKQGHRIKLLNEIKNVNEKLESTIIFYEAPHRILKMLNDLDFVFGDIRITLARELTKIHEEIKYKNISEFVAEFSNKDPRGEYVVLINPKTY